MVYQWFKSCCYAYSEKLTKVLHGIFLITVRGTAKICSYVIKLSLEV